ncbi:hypothetical protein WR30_16330 [Burkholderia contaminans FFH2055]|nr:hypothetical protein WR30_16330 [Burkholderia contaminans FFH2055]
MSYNTKTTLMRGRVEIDVAMRIGGEFLVGTVATVKQESLSVNLQESIPATWKHLTISLPESVHLLPLYIFIGF